MNLRRLRSAAIGATFAASACTLGGAEKAPAKAALVVGIDVSGSFKNQYEDAIEFASYYIYAHLHGLGGLHAPTALFVASIGGDRPGEAKAFHPIGDFSNRTQEEIAQDLRAWFPSRDAFTDFNVFFRQVATLAKERGLILAPLTLVILSDGVPDVGASGKTNPISRIDLGPLEYLSRSVTVRLLYASPTVGDEWKRLVRRKRVRLWTEEAPVMVGWRRQLADQRPLEEQDSLWKWVADNVDFRVRSSALF